MKMSHFHVHSKEMAVVPTIGEAEETITDEEGVAEHPEVAPVKQALL
jgi:hypothetical protein